MRICRIGHIKQNLTRPIFSWSWLEKGLGACSRTENFPLLLPLASSCTPRNTKGWGGMETTLFSKLLSFPSKPSFFQIWFCCFDILLWEYFKHTRVLNNCVVNIHVPITYCLQLTFDYIYLYFMYLPLYLSVHLFLSWVDRWQSTFC